MQVEVRDNPAEGRFEVVADGKVAGISTYRMHPDAVVLRHTEVEPEYRGKGLGEELARGALDQVRARGAKVVPECPFILSFIQRHVEYADLVVT